MMGLVKLINLLLELATSLSAYFRERKLIEAGENKAKVEAFKNAEKEIEKAKTASSSAVASFDKSHGMLDEADPNLRD